MPTLNRDHRKRSSLRKHQNGLEVFIGPSLRFGLRQSLAYSGANLNSLISLRLSVLVVIRCGIVDSLEGKVNGADPVSKRPRRDFVVPSMSPGMIGKYGIVP